MLRGLFEQVNHLIKRNRRHKREVKKTRKELWVVTDELEGYKVEVDDYKVQMTELYVKLSDQSRTVKRLEGQLDDQKKIGRDCVLIIAL